METLLCHDLPQEELLYLVWRTITDSDCSREMLEKVCTSLSYLLQYHMDFSHRYSEQSDTPIGFPLLCVLKTSMNEKTAKEKLQMLISNGANADIRYKPNDEETPIHFAAVNNMWHIVQFLLKENVNIDLKIKGKITRSIIASARPEFFQNDIYTVTQTLSLKEQLFDALYLKDEEKFIQLLRKNKLQYIDINVNNGRNTLLQLAIQNKCAKVGKELLENYVNLSAMAGNCVEPLCLVLQNSEFELLELFALNASRLNLKFSSNESTFLHILATQCSKESVQKYNKIDLLYILVKEAIKQEIHISAVDKYNKTAIEICIENSNNILSNILFNNGSFLTLNENIVNKIEPDVLIKYFDEKIQISSSSIQLNYEFMQPLQSCYNNSLVNGSIIVPEMLPLLEICKSEKLHEVLLHPILTFFLIYKWKQIAFIYILNFLLYLLFTTCFSLHIFSNLNSIRNNITHNEFQIDENNEGIVMYINFFITLFLWCFLIIREIFQIITSFRQYKTNPENYLEILMLFFSFLTFIPIFYKTRFIPACAVALIYIELTLLIGRHPYTETYITMFVRVALKTIKLLFIFSSFIFAFAFGFYIFFYSLNNEDLFSDLWHSVLRTSVMSAGEFSIDDIKFN
jgi:ankyrin repeat protein